MTVQRMVNNKKRNQNVRLNIDCVVYIVTHLSLDFLRLQYFQNNKRHSNTTNFRAHAFIKLKFC